MARERDCEEVTLLQMDFTIRLPRWVAELLAHSPKIFRTREDRMRFVVTLARENVQRQTGGPFGAGIFDASGCLVAPGVNIVVTRNCSILHAEMVAIALAQKTLGRYDISDEGKSDYELVASTEPCAMCFGAIPWSGVTRLVCGARDEDARHIGFDEGPKLPNWQQALEERGVQVSRDVLRQEAVDVLNLYVKMGGAIYNVRRDRG
jgi:tRNA(Arg) A34 adenosine deaminase TadA